MRFGPVRGAATRTRVMLLLPCWILVYFLMAQISFLASSKVLPAQTISPDPLLLNLNNFTRRSRSTKQESKEAFAFLKKSSSGKEATITKAPKKLTLVTAFFEEDPKILTTRMDMLRGREQQHGILLVTILSLVARVESFVKELNMELYVVDDVDLHLLSLGTPSYKTQLLKAATYLNPFASDVFVWCSGCDGLEELSHHTINGSAVFLEATSDKFTRYAFKQAAFGGWVNPTEDELYTGTTLLGGTALAIRQFSNLVTETVKPAYDRRGWPSDEVALWQSTCLQNEGLCRYWHPKRKQWWSPPMSKQLIQQPAILHQGTKYNLDPDRYLYLRPGKAGWNNQWECLHLAATIAIQQNRTLWLDAYAYQASDKHSKIRLPFDHVFDSRVLQIPVGLSNPGAYPDGCEVGLPKLHRELPESTERTLGMDPEPSARCIYWDCDFGNLHHFAPPSYFPQVDEPLLTLAPIYRKLAQRVILEIGRKVGKDENIALLGLHIRRRDQRGYPLVNCSATAYPYTSYLADDDAFYSLCSKTSSLPTKPEDELSWHNYLRHLNNCDGQRCIQDYDAVFVATDSVDYVRNANISNLFTLKDFLPSIRRDLCDAFKCSRIKDLVLQQFLVEESVLILSTAFQPSLPSSVTDMVLHQRLEMHGFNTRDIELLHLHNKKLWDLYEYRYKHPYNGRTREWD